MLLFLTIRFELLNHQTEFAASPNSFLMLVFATDAVFSTLSMVGAFRFAADSQPCSTFSFLKTLEWIGQRGYSIYLFHGPVAKLVTMAVAANKQTGPLAMLLIVVSSAGLTLLVADLSHKWLETLTANWVTRRISPARQTALASSL
jgi:peptidoglycan/LPS O-acetylase OafA/YrhL